MVGMKSWFTLSSRVTNASEYSHAFLLASHISSLEKRPLKHFALFGVARLTELYSVHSRFQTFSILIMFVVSFLRVLFTTQKLSFQEASFYAFVSFASGVV